MKRGPPYSPQILTGCRPAEIHQIHIRPADFFTSNPALDVPSAKNKTSVIVPCCGERGGEKAVDSRGKEGTAQNDAVAHLQGSGPDLTVEGAGAHVK